MNREDKLIKEIECLHKENEELVLFFKQELTRMKKNNKKLTEEIDKLKKEKLKLIKENNKINKRLSSYEKYNDMPSEEEIEKQYKEYYSSLENELYYE